MMRLWNQLFLSPRLLFIMGGISILYLVSYFVPVIQMVPHLLTGLLLIFTIVDTLVLFYQPKIEGQRQVQERFSNSDQNLVSIVLKNKYPFSVHLKIVEELPYQFQLRNKILFTTMKPGTTQTLQYQLRPTERGVYHFGLLNIVTRSPIGLIYRRYVEGDAQTVLVYPSYLQLSKYEMKHYANKTPYEGNKKHQRIGNSSEFDQIKDYILGDDIRHINWKASAKKNSLMVNKFVEEKSQQIYCILDGGRHMEMPFNQMSLLDYSINATLSLSNVILKNHDKVGLLHFNKKIETHLAPEKYKNQLNRVNNALYHLKTDYLESDFGVLYNEIQSKVNHRSLLILFTNFEDIHSLKRQLPYLKAISKKHLLCIILFVNNELEDLAGTSQDRLENTIKIALAEKFIYQKKLIVKELKKNGIQAILTTPQHLTLKSIDTYLKIKSRGML